MISSVVDSPAGNSWCSPLTKEPWGEIHLVWLWLPFQYVLQGGFEIAELSFLNHCVQRIRGIYSYYWQVLANKPRYRFDDGGDLTFG